MQSWPRPGQGDGDGHDQWQANFAYGNPSAQFDPSQAWAQPMPDQPTDFSHIPPQDTSAQSFYDPARGTAYLPPAGLQNSPPPNQTGFHPSQGELPLAQQYSRPEQDSIDPTFGNVHPELFSQQAKPNVGTPLNQYGHGQGHQHAHAQAYAQQPYDFAPQGDQYQQQAPQYTPQQLLQQQGRHPARLQEQQRFGAVSPPQQHEQQPASHGRPLAPAVNGQPGPYQPGTPVSYQQQQAFFAPGQRSQVQQQQQQPSHLYQQNVHTQTQHASQSQSPTPQPTAQTTQALQQASNAQYNSEAQSMSGENIVTEPAPKKRKRTTKTTPESSTTPEISSPQGGYTEGYGKQQEIDGFAAPAPSPDEAQLLAQFSKRTKAAQAKYPSIKGIPHLVFDGSTKMPAPKSFDKLAPLVTLPSRSGKSMVPELAYDLPCEIQGKFTSQYRPNPDKGGLDERRIEAKPLLDQFEASMKALGKRRPKYTEYPHAFKEQLKSDEASKNKAEKRAKKEQDGGKPIRAPTRPSDPIEAAVWDTIGMVQVEPTAARTSSLIAGRVQQAGDLLIKLRTDMNKAKLEMDQAVKDKVPEPEIASLKVGAEQKKEALYRALDATVEHADDAVLDNLGGHQKLILSLINVLIACIKAADFSSKLPKIVLELFTHFRMTKRIIETTNFDTVRRRFEDKGDDEVKELIRDINAKIKKASKPEAETATGYTGTSAASRAKAAKPTETATSVAKRGREDDPDTRTVKKVAVESGGGALSKKLGQSRTLAQPAAKTGASSLLPGKARPTPKPATKTEPTSVDSPPNSADDKVKLERRNAPTDKAEASKPVVATKAEPKPPAPKMAPTALSSSALSGIASLLDSINAPKAETPPAPVKETKEPDADETPEEKAKRLRKESRRKLRVSWKPESELVQTRIFHKDDEEDEGRASNMIQDAADDRSEGMVLKQRAGMDEDEDDEDVPYQPWLGPVEIDLSLLPEETRNKNFVTRGGNVTFSTEEQKRIAEREQRELMAIYTDPADIPPSPKSPPPETAALPTRRVGQLPGEDPKFVEIQRRWAEAQQMGVEESIHAAMRRLDSKKGPSNILESIFGSLRNTTTTAAPPQQQQPATAQAFQPAASSSAPLVVGRVAEESILAWLRSDKTKTWLDPNPVHGDFSRPYHHMDPTVQAAGSIVEALAKYLAGQPYPATSPPEWMLSHEDKVKEWWFGYNKEAAVRQRKADEERTRIEAEVRAGRANPQEVAAYYAQQQEYAPYMAILQQMTGQQPQGQAPPPPPPPPQLSAQQQQQINDSQLQSILAAINQGPQQSGGQDSGSNYSNNDTSYQQMMLLSQMAQGQSSQGGANHSADRDWDRHDGSSSRDEYRDKDGKKKKATLPPHKPVNKALIGTKPCTFWQQGKCARGDQCTFRHD